MKLNFFCVSGNTLNTVAEQLTYLEKSITYPFGDDKFTIDHGKDYFTFFNLLGKVFCCGYKLENKIIASVVCILRTIDDDSIWYMADLKIYLKVTNINLLNKLKQDMLPLLSDKSNKFYAINMNSRQQQNGRIARVLNRKIAIEIQYLDDLAIYLLDMQQIKFCINNFFDDYQMISMEGKKDLIMQSTGCRLPLIHVQLKNKFSNIINTEYLQPNNKFMFCTLMKSKLQCELYKQNIYPVATAAVIHSGMQSSNWNFITTSEL